MWGDTTNVSTVTEELSRAEDARADGVTLTNITVVTTRRTSNGGVREVVVNRTFVRESEKEGVKKVLSRETKVGHRHFTANTIYNRKQMLDTNE